MEDKKIINKTTFCTSCKNCGHTRDWHHTGDLFFTMLFGTKLGKCRHYTKDETLPFWKRKKIYCNCKKFVPDKLTSSEPLTEVKKK